MLAASQCVSRPTEAGGVQSADVNELLEFSEMRYAVIEALQIESGPERFVIAYSTEQSLHDFIAAPRIIAFGFFSQAEAIASSEASPTVGGPRAETNGSRPSSSCSGEPSAVL